MKLHLRTIAVRVAVVALLAAPIAFADAAAAGKSAEKKQDKSAAKQSDASETSVFAQATAGDKRPKKSTYTNEDLERLFGPPPSDSAGETRESRSGDDRRDAGQRAEAAREDHEDPLAWVEERRKAEAERRGRITELEKKVAAARKRVGELEQTRLRVSNPYLGLAAKAPEGETDWDEIDNKERLERTKDRLEKAREELKQAEADLAKAKGS